MSVIGVIPVRLASTRLAEKALLAESGKFLFQHVFEQACLAKRLDTVCVATGDPEITAAAESFGAPVRQTDADLPSGSDRVWQAVLEDPEAELIVNIQGDEPLIEPADLDALVEAVRSGADAATLAATWPEDLDPADPDSVKVVSDRHGQALYFSRSPVPAGGPHRLHLGVYAFRRDTLAAFAEGPPGRLEKSERLEQLRMLEMGFRISVVDAISRPLGIDTRADYDRFLERLS